VSEPPYEGDYFPDEPPRFRLGDLVKHHRYGYRAVVVDFDMSCKADDRWYQSNQTQPPRDQPWYHLLVDGSAMTTYAAQSNLEPDDRDAAIAHPLVGHFFEGFHQGRYERNDRPWPGVT